MTAQWRYRARLALTGLILVGLAFSAGVAIVPKPLPWLSPSYGQPRDQAAAAQRATALLMGQVRPTDGLTFDAWYRARLNRLAPGIQYRYEALLNGNDIGGYWAVYAVVIAGPAYGPSNTVDVLNEDGGVGSVDEATGRVTGLSHSCVSVSSYQGGCVAEAQPVQQTWFDDFRSGARP